MTRKARPPDSGEICRYLTDVERDREGLVETVTGAWGARAPTAPVRRHSGDG